MTGQAEADARMYRDQVSMWKEAFREIKEDLDAAASREAALREAAEALRLEVDALRRARAFQDELIEEHMRACAMPNSVAAVAHLRAVLPAAEAEMVTLPYVGNSQIHEAVKAARAWVNALTNHASLTSEG